MDNSTLITRQQFLDYFNSDRYGEEIDPDTCFCIFLRALKGSSDLTTKNMEDLFSSYDQAYPVPILREACEQTGKQDCRCEENYLCYVCQCRNAVKLVDSQNGNDAWVRYYELCKLCHMPCHSHKASCNWKLCGQ